tara:strand:- start:1849 stop:2148 length:300 start_codon:yes stop_codon:yes gene_type:complete
MAKTKKGPLSKAEAFYIDGNHKSMDVVDIATDLNRSITSIESYIKKNHNKEHVAGTKAGDHFHSHKGSTVMTENASTMSDEKKKVNTNNFNPKCMTRIK